MFYVPIDYKIKNKFVRTNFKSQLYRFYILQQWLPDPRIRSDPRSAEKFPVPKIRDPILRKSQISGSEIRIRENLNLDPDPWIRDPNYFVYDPDPGFGSEKKRILDPILRIFGIRRIQSDPG